MAFIKYYKKGKTILSDPEDRPRFDPYVNELKSKGITPQGNSQLIERQTPILPPPLPPITFGQQFAQARKQALKGGPKTFMWKGKEYGTQLQGETSTGVKGGTKTTTSTPMNIVPQIATTPEGQRLNDMIGYRQSFGVNSTTTAPQQRGNVPPNGSVQYPKQNGSPTQPTQRPQPKQSTQPQSKTDQFIDDYRWPLGALGQGLLYQGERYLNSRGKTETGKMRPKAYSPQPTSPQQLSPKPAEMLNKNVPQKQLSAYYEPAASKNIVVGKSNTNPNLGENIWQQTAQQKSEISKASGDIKHQMKMNAQRNAPKPKSPKPFKPGTPRVIEESPLVPRPAVKESFVGRRNVPTNTANRNYNSAAKGFNKGLSKGIMRSNALAIPLQILIELGIQKEVYDNLVQQYGIAGANEYIRKAQKTTNEINKHHYSDETKQAMGSTAGFFNKGGLITYKS